MKRKTNVMLACQLFSATKAGISHVLVNRRMY